MRIEVEKTRQAHKISKQCGLFHVPEVLDYDASTGTAKFEFMHNLQTVREVAAAGPMAERLLRAYFKATDYSYDHQEFVCYMKSFMHNKLLARGKRFHFKRRLLLIPSHIKLRRFIASFHP